MDSQQIITVDGSNESEYYQASIIFTGLNQFRINPFRVLRLPAATSKQAIWQAEKILSLVRLNLPPKESDPLPWLPGNNEMEIKQAVQKMEEPLQRLVENLLWFDFESDPKGELLYEGLLQVGPHKLRDYLQIKNLGLTLLSLSDLEKKNGDSKLHEIFTHCINQANLRLLLALSLFHDIGPQMIDKVVPTNDKNDRPLKLSWGKESNFSFLMNPHDLLEDTEDSILKNSYWQELWVDALNSWYEILTNPHFSSYLKHLFNKLGDEMLDEGAIETISHAVPVRLADILVGEIKNSLNRGTDEKVLALVDIAANAQFDKPWNASFNTLHYFFQSDLSEINCLIEDDTAVSKENIRHFFKRIDEVKLKWKGIDPQDVLGLLKLVDDSVLKGLDAIALLDYYGDNLKVVEDLLNEAVEIAHSNSVQERINSYRSQINQWHQYSTCHFCEKRKSDPNYPVIIKGKKETGKKGNTTYYSIKPAIVPRCENCADFHNFIKALSIKSALIALFLLILIISTTELNIIFKGIGSIFVAIFSFNIWLGCMSIYGVFWIASHFVKIILRESFASILVPKGQKTFYDIEKTKGYYELISEGYYIETIDLSKDALKNVLG